MDSWTCMSNKLVCRRARPRVRSRLSHNAPDGNDVYWAFCSALGPEFGWLLDFRHRSLVCASWPQSLSKTCLSPTKKLTRIANQGASSREVHKELINDGRYRLSPRSTSQIAGSPGISGDLCQ